ncbi:hypothetical protein [Tengunoibacter tsumagoiensis]|uniref:Uncharacterized protein n=1 Tax=Tengunoibacter tsumagoiensis TaxID=2014871 RepID=A0A402A3K1_9CHLR|nr:hypothetical protein [Tengunoibacter tsumagoiensis]GCE13615.1 hypothetical protein KTT_34740 [Tengunoibacter tsumagoiensis]
MSEQFDSFNEPERDQRDQYNQSAGFGDEVEDDEQWDTGFHVDQDGNVMSPEQYQGQQQGPVKQNPVPPNQSESEQYETSVDPKQQQSRQGQTQQQGKRQPQQNWDPYDDVGPTDPYNEGGLEL